MTTFISLDSNLDINSLFNFDLLKDVLQVVMTSQKSLIKKITAIESNNLYKEKQITR